MGGVGQLYQGDLDLGRLAARRLIERGAGPDVLVEDFYYGAVAVAQRLQELEPEGLVLVGAVAGGRSPGSVLRRRVTRPLREPKAAQASVADAVTGYVTLDLLIDVCSSLGALPERTTAIEVEPASSQPSEHLSPEVSEALGEAVEMAVAEARRIPVLNLADLIGEALSEGRISRCEALEAMEDLLTELRFADEEGRWGAAFALRDRVRMKVAEGRTGEGMSHLDWGLWWTLLEALDRLQSLEAVPDRSGQRSSSSPRF